MKRYVLKCMKIGLAIIAVGILARCAGEVKRVQFPAEANANTEIQNLESDLAQAKQQQIDVASPSSWRHAEKALANAKTLREKAGSQREILMLVGESKAALNEATLKALETKKQLFDIMAIRGEAQASQVEKYYSKEFNSVDSDLKDKTEEFEGGHGKISANQRLSLQKQYSDLELKAIIATHLSSAKGLVETAEKNQASRYAPQSLETAKAKIASAEATIATNRKDSATIEEVSAIAMTEAETLVRITRDARVAKGQSAEAIAKTLDSQKSELAVAGSSLEKSEQRNRTQGTQMQQKNSQMREMTTANSELKSREAFNESFTKAQNSFTANQADVYRQGDSLLIRLKSGNFSSGSSDLSGNSFAVLNQVKDLVASMKAEKVVIEGHTDSMGSKDLNLKLSKKRADAVASYISSSNTIEPSHVVAEGYGFDKPLATNKTAAGRSMNRRVDIIITPEKIE